MEEMSNPLKKVKKTNKQLKEINKNCSKPEDGNRSNKKKTAIEVILDPENLDKQTELQTQTSPKYTKYELENLRL